MEDKDMNNDFQMMVKGLQDSGRLNVSSPWSGEIIGSVPMIDSTGAETALQIAHGVYSDRNKWLPISQRIDILSASIAWPHLSI